MRLQPQDAASAYLLATRQLVEWVGREPATWTEEDIRAYFLYLRDEAKLAPSSVNVRLATAPCCDATTSQ